MSDYETQPPGDNATEMNEIRRSESEQNRGKLVIEQPKAVTQDSVVVTIQQPSLNSEKERYQVGLLSCFKNWKNCLCAVCCPCFVTCKIGKRIDENPLYGCFCGVLPLTVRFRTLVGIKQDMCWEGLLHTFLPCCSALRTLNEMETREFQYQKIN